jgi:Fic family protein
VRTDGDWRGWIAYFLEGVQWTARRAMNQATLLADLREVLRRRLRDRGKALILLDELFMNPYITVAHAESILDVTNPTARQIVELLEREGVLEENIGSPLGAGVSFEAYPEGHRASAR